MTDQRPLRPIGSTEYPSGGGPAFPVNVDPSVCGFTYGHGLSKREHFAALFVAGMMANSAIGKYTIHDDIAHIAIGQADVLIEALAKADRGDS